MQTWLLIVVGTFLFQPLSASFLALGSYGLNQDTVD